MIRLKNLDLNVPGLKRTSEMQIGVIPVGVTNKTLFAAPLDCTVDSVVFYPTNGISANTSNTFQIHVYAEGASGSNTTLQAFTVNTSAATNTYSAGQPITLTPSAANSLTAGALILLQVSAVCQAVLSSTLCLVYYTPLKHRATR